MNPTPMPDIDLANMTNPFTLVFLAALVGGLVRILKTKTVNDLVAKLPPTWIKGIPAWLLPWLAVGIAGLLAFLNDLLNAHGTPKHAAAVGLLGAIMSGGTAIGGHETIAKLLGLLIPKASSSDPNATPPANGQGPAGGGFARRMLAFTASVLVVVSFLAASARGPVSAPPAVEVAGCTPAQARFAETALLSLADMACIEASRETNAAALITGCKLVDSPELRAFVDSFIGQREAARRAGFKWPGSAGDGGREGGP